MCYRDAVQGASVTTANGYETSDLSSLIYFFSNINLELNALNTYFFVQVLSTTRVAAFNTGLPLTFNTVAVLCDRKHMQNNEYRWL